MYTTHESIAALFEHDQTWLSREEIKTASGDGGTAVFRTQHPLFWSNGFGYIKGFTAIEELLYYNERYPDTDPLQLKQYNNRYDLLLQDLNDPTKDTTFRVSAALSESAVAFFNQTLGANAWNSLTEAERAALVTKFYAVGRLTLEDTLSLEGEYTPNWAGEGTDIYLFQDNAHRIKDALTGSLVQCFSGDTLIVAANGVEKPISEVKVGDDVLAFNVNTDCAKGALVVGRVTRVLRGFTTEWIELFGVDGATTRVTPNHPYLRPDGSFAAIQNILATDGLVVDAMGVVCHVMGRVIRATDAGSDATLIEQEPNSIGRTLVKPLPTLGWLTYNFTVEGLHTYVAGGFRVHNKCKYDTEDIVNVAESPDGRTATVLLVDQVTGEPSTITHTVNPTTGELAYVERKTYFGPGTDTYVTNGWGSFDQNGNVTGTSDFSLIWRNTNISLGHLDGLVLRRQQTVVGGYDMRSLEWVDSNQNPLLKLDLKFDPITNAALSMTATEADWSGVGFTTFHRTATTYNADGSELVTHSTGNAATGTNIVTGTQLHRAQHRDHRRLRRRWHRVRHREGLGGAGSPDAAVRPADNDAERHRALGVVYRLGYFVVYLADDRKS